MWDTRYRPTRFADVLGQEGSIQVLKSRLRNGSGLETSYLFSGGHGTGKTTLARIHARALLCDNLGADQEPCNTCDNCQDILNSRSEAFVEQDAATNGTVDVIRSIVDSLPFAVRGARKRVYLFDEAQRMSKDAQDALLKPIEDKKLVCMFCTTEPDKIRGPIQSRCEDYSIRKVTREAIAKRMGWVLTQEKAEFEEDAVLTVVDACNGHVRDILNKLEMIAQIGPVSVEAVRAQLNLGVATTYFQILLALGTPQRSVPLLEQACDRVGPEDVATGLAEAAMNAYRLAQGLFADLSVTDKTLSGQVFQMYGDNLIPLAEFFLQSYRPSKIGLICDVVRCASGVPSKQPQARPAGPPVVVAAVAPIESPPAALEPSSEPAPYVELAGALDEPPPTTPSQTSAAVPSPSSSAAAAPTSSPPVPDKPLDPKLRSDGIGALGTSDRLALTDYDHKAVREDFPRDANRNKERNREARGVQLVTMLPAIQWSQEFEKAWLGARNGKGS